MQTPKTQYEKDVYRNYCLRNGRVYRFTAKGLGWVVSRGMRREILKASHDDIAHFGLQQTLRYLTETYWFPKMRRYVKKYNGCCILCLYNKKSRGKQEGYLHSIEKIERSVPFHTIHIDHLGPFNKFESGNVYLIIDEEAVIKFTILRAVTNNEN